MGWLRSGTDHEVVLLGKPGCHLCDAAREVVERVCADLSVPWRERNILEDEELVHAYAEMIPVTLVDGKQHDYFRVDERRLRRALR